MLSPPINTPVFEHPTRPLKSLHTAPKSDSEPEPKKLCAPPSDSGCKVDKTKASSCVKYYCGVCRRNCDHSTKDCPFYDSDTEDEINLDIEEFKGDREGYAFNCLLGCSGSTCKNDHGRGMTRGLYLPKVCTNCSQWGHWTSECSKPSRS